MSAGDKTIVVGNQNKLNTDRAHLSVPLAKSQRYDAGNGGDNLPGGLPLIQVPRVASWADSAGQEDSGEDGLSSPSENVDAQLVPENEALHAMPSVGTWFGLSPDQEVLQRIQACKYSSWDPIWVDARTY